MPGPYFAEDGPNAGSLGLMGLGAPVAGSDQLVPTPLAPGALDPTAFGDVPGYQPAFDVRATPRPAPAAPTPGGLSSVFGAYSLPPAEQAAPAGAARPGLGDFGYSFTEDEVARLAEQQGADPKAMRKALEKSGATIVKPRPAVRAGQAGVQAPARAGAPGGGAGGGGFRKLLDKELQTRVGARDQAAAAYQEADKGLRAANDALVGVQQAGLNAEAAGLEQIGNEQAKAQADVDRARQFDAAKRQQEDQAVAQQQETINLGWKQLADATVGDRRTPGERTMALFGVALSGLADAILMSQGQRGNFQTQAMGLVEHQIERDVDAQLEQLGRNRENLTQRERALVTFKDQVGDDRAFRDFMIAKRWEDLSHVSSLVETRTKNELKKNAAAELRAFADAKVAEGTAQGTAGALQAAQDRVREAQDLGFSLSLKQAMGAGKPKAGRSGYGLRVIDPSRPPQDAEIGKAQEIVSGAAGITDTIAQLKAMARKGATLSPTERNIALRRVASLTAQFNGVFGDGTAPNETQMELYSNIFNNPTEFHVSDVEREFQALEDDAKSQTNAKIRPYNVTLENLDVRPE